MNIVLLSSIILHSVSIGFLGLCLIRLFSYTRRHKLEENHYTMLCGFIRLEHMVMAYVTLVVAFTVGSLLIILTLMNP